jgi:hypothetical protein
MLCRDVHRGALSHHDADGEEQRSEEGETDDHSLAYQDRPIKAMSSSRQGRKVREGWKGHKRAGTSTTYAVAIATAAAALVAFDAF